MKILLKHIFLIGLLFFNASVLYAQQPTQKQLANKFLDSVGIITQSNFWPRVKPDNFIQNLRRNINQPIFVYAGSNTNFCGFAAMSYSCISNYPLRYARFMVELYNNGKANFRNIDFNPSKNIKLTAGRLRFKGELDINQADQMWFLTLADHFKGYLNWINLSYEPGDEDRFWAATNFAKFNRMIKKMCDYEVKSIGSDLIRPTINDLPAFIAEKLATNHQVFLYLNNTILHKKDHNKIKKRIPTHYVVLLNIMEHDGMVTLTYWDYGFKTLQQLPIKVVKKIIFGITWCKKKSEA